MTDHQSRIRKQLEQGDYMGWFDTVYEAAYQQNGVVPWARMSPNKLMVRWMKHHRPAMKNRRALVIGCGLGDDAEYLAGLGADVVAFDISPKAIQWARERFPETAVHYRVANLLEPPDDWPGNYDFIFEANTVQALPLDLRARALKAIADLMALGSELLLICRARPDEEHNPPGPPWAVSQRELKTLETSGLQCVQFEDFHETSGQRRFRAYYQRP